MDEVDIGPPTSVLFTRVEFDGMGSPVAAFVSDDGEAFCLPRELVELRIRYLEAGGRERREEHRALNALRAY